MVAAVVEHYRDPGAAYGEVVLARGIGWPATFFGLVTGFLEKGESVEQGVLREVKEELGLDGKLGRLIGVYDFKRQNQVIIAYHVVVRGGEVVLQTEELEEYKHVPLFKVTPWREGTGMAVRDFLSFRLPEVAAAEEDSRPASKL